MVEATNWYREQIRDNLKRCVFERALLADSKANMLEQVAAHMSEGDARGPRFYVLLFYHLAQVGLHRMTFRYKSDDEDDIVSVFYQFAHRWDTDVRLCKATVLAESLP